MNTTIENNLTRLKQARLDIATAIREKAVDVPIGYGLEEYPNVIRKIDIVLAADFNGINVVAKEILGI